MPTPGKFSGKSSILLLWWCLVIKIMKLWNEVLLLSIPTFDRNYIASQSFARWHKSLEISNSSSRVISLYIAVHRSVISLISPVGWYTRQSSVDQKSIVWSTNWSTRWSVGIWSHESGFRWIFERIDLYKWLYISWCSPIWTVELILNPQSAELTIEDETTRGSARGTAGETAKVSAEGEEREVTRVPYTQSWKKETLPIRGKYGDTHKNRMFSKF